MNNKFLTKKEVDKYWRELLKSKEDLFIYTLTTKDISKNWSFLYRNKIINLVTPENIKIVNIEFSKKYCLKESYFSKNKNYLTIHSVMIRDLINNLNPKSYCLILDIDAFPLSEYAIKLTFVLAMLKGINGNIQRTNCIENGKHLFIAPSYLCFNTIKIKELGELAWIANNKSDVSEEITWEKPELIDQNLFMPLRTLFKPIWALKEEKKVYGIGTTFGYNNLPINYHHFYSRNFIARFHFFLISFFFYLKIKFSLRDPKRLNFKDIIHDFFEETKFSIKYFLGKIL